jgi:hypothetical protein
MELWVPASITDEVEPKEEKNIKKREVTKKASPYRFTTQWAQCRRTEFYKTYDDSAD